MHQLIHKHFTYLLSRLPVAAKARGFPKERKATVAVEFALIGPVLFMLVVGAGVFGIAINNYIQVTGAASVGARQLAISRGVATPYADTVSQIKGAAPSLVPANITITLKVNGTACATDAACTTALVAGVPAQVIATYPCFPGNLNLTVYGTQYSPNCTLTANTTERVQ